MNTIESQRQHFDDIADSYLESRNNKAIEYLVDKMWNVLLKNVALPAVDKVHFLDAMCGNGDTFDGFRKLCSANIKYSAFDYSPKMVAIAKEKHPGCRIWEQDITTFCEPDTYDIICIFGGLHHVHGHLQQVMSNIRDSLKVNGIFFSCEPTHSNSFFGKIRDYIYIKNAIFDHKTEKGFSIKELDNIASANHLFLERQIYPGLLSYVLITLPMIIPKTGKFFDKNIVKSAYFKLTNIECHLWDTTLARFFTFATFGCYRKLQSH